MLLKKIKIALTSLLIILGVLAFQSCTERAIFDQTYSFDNNEWAKNETVTFTVDIQDTLSIRNFSLTLRTSKNYLYNNLWVYISVTAPDGSTSKVAEELPLAYPDGSWIGRLSGTLVENKIRFDARTFPLKGEYIFEITNATQQDVITEVYDLGLRIE